MIFVVPLALIIASFSSITQHSHLPIIALGLPQHYVTHMMIFALGLEPNFIEILSLKLCYFAEFISEAIVFLSFASAKVSALSFAPR